MVSRAGLEPIRPIVASQVIDSTIRQKRQNRYFSRTEVHSGYTDYKFVVGDARTRHMKRPARGSGRQRRSCSGGSTAGTFDMTRRNFW